MLGGWDGSRNMGDFWRYDLAGEGGWTMISSNTADHGGPAPRSCHQMCLDSRRQRLYVLGRYIDPSERAAALESDFFCYDVAGNTWTQLASHTAEQKGPDLVFDHQMCMDEVHNTIYVLGGRCEEPKPKAKAKAKAGE